jgi:hypothetical protein
MKINNIGMGIIIIEDLFTFDKSLIKDYINWLKNGNENAFEYRIEDGIEYAFNKTGFRFKVEDVRQAPQRFMDLKGLNRLDKPGDHFLNIVSLLEDFSYKALVEYCKIFSDAATTAWWRPNGHIAGYCAGQGIGPHCDDQVPFEWGKETGNQNSMHNSTSINLYLNDCVLNSDELDDFTYTGGELRFPHADYTWKPKMGSVALYPSSYVGRHEVLPVTAGERYAFLTVACYGTDFNQKELVGEENPQKIWMPRLSSDIMITN